MQPPQKTASYGSGLSAAPHKHGIASSNLALATNTKPMRKTFTTKFAIGDMVILRTEPELKRIVTGLVLRQGGKMYELVNGVESSWHQEVEIESAPEKARPIKGFK